MKFNRRTMLKGSALGLLGVSADSLGKGRASVDVSATNGSMVNPATNTVSTATNTCRSTSKNSAVVDISQNFTPLVGEVLSAPIPFTGSDGQTYLAYELMLTNFTTGPVTIEQLEVINADTGAAIHVLDADEVANRLQPAGRRDTVASFDPAMTALVFLHVNVDESSDVPERLIHRVSLKAEAAPPDQQELVESVGEITVDLRDVVTVGPPLRGSNYIAADSFGDAVRHTRATLPVNGQIWLAQRYAVDYEQLDAKDRIFDGPREDLESYTIYGEKAIAVADGTVVKVVDGVPENVPGEFPEEIILEKADGNAVILDLGCENYALYAHFQPGSIRVAEGDHVEQGDVLGLVGNSGNSIAPHLHFHVMNRPLSLASNGLPYLVDSFTILGQTAGTTAFDQAEADGQPLAVNRFDPPVESIGTLPLDQIVVDFD